MADRKGRRRTGADPPAEGLQALLQTPVAGFELEDLTDTLRTWPEGRLWQVDLWLKRAD